MALTDDDVDAILDAEVVTGLTVRQCLARLHAVLVGESDTTTAPGTAIFANPDGSESHRQAFDMITGSREPAEFPGG